MNFIEFKDKLQEFPVFSVREIGKYFPGFDSRRLVEWQEKGYIQKIRNQFYRFDQHMVDEAYLYYCANTIYSPSYVSLESALSFYGFIPEGVFQITSCTTLKTNSFETPAGNFDYRNLKTSLFFGYNLKPWNGHHYAIAGPEKTVIDYLYLHNEIESATDFESLRWNAIEITNTLSLDLLNRYVKYIDSKALSNRITHLMNYVNANS
jgi:predicted transcriptional regulator of viral defense system